MQPIEMRVTLTPSTFQRNFSLRMIGAKMAVNSTQKLLPIEIRIIFPYSRATVTSLIKLYLPPVNIYPEMTSISPKTYSLRL